MPPEYHSIQGQRQRLDAEVTLQVEQGLPGDVADLVDLRPVAAALSANYAVGESTSRLYRHVGHRRRMLGAAEQRNAVAET
jgi:hypothetical protein